MKQSDKSMEEFFSKRYEDMELEMDGVDQLWSRIEGKTKPDRKFPFWLLGVAVGLCLGGWLMESIVGSGVVEDNNELAQTKVERKMSSKANSVEITTQQVSEYEIQKPLVNQSEPKSLGSHIEEAATTHHKSPVNHIDELKKEHTTNTISSNLVNNNIINSGADPIENSSNVEAPVVHDFISDVSIEINTYKSYNQLDNIELLPSLVSKLNFVSIPNIATQDLEMPSLGYVEIFPKFKPAFLVKTSLSGSKPFDQLETLDRVSLLGSELKSEAYSTLHEQYFNPLVSVGARIEGLYQLSPNFGLSIGMEYMQTSSQFQAERIELDRVVSFNPMAYFQNVQGEVEWLGEDTYGQQLLMISEYETVKEFDLNIPVGLYFNLLERNKLSAAFTAEVIFNLKYQYDGQFLDETQRLNFVSTSNLEGDFLERTAYGAGIALGYQLGDQATLCINPRMRLRPKLWSSSLVRLSRLSLEASVGISYKIAH